MAEDIQPLQTLGQSPDALASTLKQPSALIPISPETQQKRKSPQSPNPPTSPPRIELPSKRKRGRPRKDGEDRDAQVTIIKHPKNIRNAKQDEKLQTKLKTAIMK